MLLRSPRSLLPEVFQEELRSLVSAEKLGELFEVLDEDDSGTLEAREERGRKKQKEQ